MEAGRSIYYRAASAVDRGDVDPALIAMAKWYTCEIAVKVADEAIQLHGGDGILKEDDVEHYWRDAKVFEIFEGTKEVEKVLIGRKLLWSLGSRLLNVHTVRPVHRELVPRQAGPPSTSA